MVLMGRTYNDPRSYYPYPASALDIARRIIVTTNLTTAPTACIQIRNPMRRAIPWRALTP